MCGYEDTGLGLDPVLAPCAWVVIDVWAQVVLEILALGAWMLPPLQASGPVSAGGVLRWALLVIGCEAVWDCLAVGWPGCACGWWPLGLSWTILRRWATLGIAVAFPWDRGMSVRRGDCAALHPSLSLNVIST